MLNWSFRLLLAACIALTTKGAFIQDVDWVTVERANKPIPIRGPSECSEYTSPYGFFRHWSSGKYVHYVSSTGCPWTDEALFMYSNNETAIPFRFVQEIGHYGYLEHECPDNVTLIVPYGGSLIPDDDTSLVIHWERQPAALFTMDHQNMKIIHRSGMTVWPHLGPANPDNHTHLVVHEMSNDASKFEFVHIGTLLPLPLFPDPHLFGYWRMIYAVIEPVYDFEVDLQYTVGRSVSEQASEEYKWIVSSRASALWFENSFEFKEYAGITDGVTWEDETTRMMKLKVSAGTTVVTWQYFFEAKQFGDGLLFRSTIIADTSDVNNPPQTFKILVEN